MFNSKLSEEIEELDSYTSFDSDKGKPFVYLYEAGEKEEGGETKAKGIFIIFATWNTMVGSALTTIPWAFQESGLFLGVIISFTSFLVSFYTCALVLKTAKGDVNYVFTLKRYWGTPGFYAGLIPIMVMVAGSLNVYFTVIVHSAYPLIHLFLKDVCQLKDL